MNSEKTGHRKLVQYISSQELGSPGSTPGTQGMIEERLPVAPIPIWLEVID